MFQKNFILRTFRLNPQASMRGKGIAFLRQARYYRNRPRYVYFNDSRQYNQSSWWSRFFAYARENPRVTYGTVGVFTLFLVTHIDEAPVTHRYRLMMTAEWVENYFTQQSFRQVMAEYGNYILPSYHPISKQVSSIMVRLIAAAHDYKDPTTGERVNLFTVLGKSDIPLDKWEFYVIDDVRMGRPSPNAFVIGGGKVFLFKSLLPICEDTNGLATVLSHELGHLLADHLGERLSLSPLLFTLNIIMFSIFGSSRPGDILVNMLLNRSFSREMETEADYIGLMVMSRACFDPAGAQKLWRNMLQFEQQQGGSVPELVSTHPSSERRLENINGWMSKAKGIYEENGCYKDLRSFWYR